MLQPFRTSELAERHAARERPLSSGERVRVLGHVASDAGRSAVVWLVSGRGIARRLIVRFDDRHFGIFDDADLTRAD